MANHKSTLWQIEAHTQAKHKILRRYLGAWFPIMASRQSRLVYIDGFCGPGRYEGGEDGSPVIALKVALDQTKYLAKSRVTFLFVDERQDRIKHLDSELAKLRTPNNFSIQTEVNKFDGTLNQILDQLDSQGLSLAPTFAFIDPFGIKGMPFDTVRRLLGCKRTEVLINFMVEYVNRFVENPDPSIRNHIRELLGVSDDDLMRVLKSSNRVGAFRQLYQRQLERHAKYVRYFEMRDDDNRVIYYLFFASNHRLGHLRMKEAFWKVDTQSGFYFSDHTNPDQPVLLALDPSLDLAKQLKQKFTGTTRLAEEIVGYVEDDTPYITSHAKKALQRLEATGEIEVDTYKKDGSKRKKNSFPDGVVIRFQ